MSISSTTVRGAEIEFIPAPPSLKRHIGCFWVISGERDATLRLVPDGSTAISIQLEAGRTSGWSLRGPLLRPDERTFTAPALLVGVRLRPGVAFILSGIAAHSIVDRRIALCDLPLFRRLMSFDGHLTDPLGFIDALRRFLVERLENTAVNDVVTTALETIHRAHGSISATDVAAHCGVSSRHLNRLMRVWIGFGAKRYANIARFQATLEEMERSPRSTAAQLASEGGYFDQAHLSGDVSRFSGTTPGHLASRCVSDFSKTRCDDLP